MGLFLVLAGLLSLSVGCQKKNEGGSASLKSGGTENTSVETTANPVTMGTSSKSEADSVVQTMNTTPVTPVLQGMVKAYHEAHAYRDNGEIQIKWTQNGETWERKVPYRTNLERPNRVQLQVNDTIISADGKDFWAYTPQMPGMIIRRPCVPEIQLKDLLCDREIYLNLTNVESKRFSFLPAPLVLLLGQKPLETFLYGIEKQNLTMLAEKAIDTAECYRISARRGEEETIFWIDKTTYVLRRVELPTQVLQQEKSTPGANIDAISMTLEFQNAEINGAAGQVTTTVALPTNVKEVTNYAPPQLEMLGEQAPDFALTTLDGRKVTLADLQGKAVVLLFWTSYGDSVKFVFEQMEKLIQKYPNDPELVFLAANIEPESVTNQTLQATQAKLQSSALFVRDIDGVLMRKFRSNGVFSVFLLDKNGTIQSFETEYSPNMSEVADVRIRQLREGRSIYADVLRQVDKARQDYIESINRWIENGVFLDQAELTQVSVPESRISPSSEPVAFKTTELWRTSELKTPGTILAIPASDAANDQILVLENGNTVTELDANGKVVQRHDLKLAEGDFQIALLTARNPADGKRFFATYGKVVHLFDENWNPLMAYPSADSKTLTDLVADVEMNDLDEDGQLEFYVSFWSGEGIHKVAMTGELLAQNASTDVVFQLASTRNALVPTEGQMPQGGATGTSASPVLLCIDQSGMISILDSSLRTWGTLQTKDHTLGWLTAYDLDADKTDDFAAIAIAVGSKYTALGLDNTGKVTWSLPLPAGIYPRPIDKIFPVQLKSTTDSAGQWLVLGADSSLHLIGGDGILIDRFNFGKIITGLTSATLNGKPRLLIATPDDVRALEFTW